jgi:hypothetical protein
MNPIQANSDFFRNTTGVNVFLTLVIHNTNAVPMPILSAAGGAMLTTLKPGETITAVFFVKNGQVLFSPVAGTCEFLNISYP